MAGREAQKIFFYVELKILIFYYTVNFLLKYNIKKGIYFMTMKPIIEKPNTKTSLNKTKAVITTLTSCILDDNLVLINS